MIEWIETRELVLDAKPPKPADMVVVVRCRDCKRYQPREGQMLSCKFEYKDFTQWRSAEPDGFCAWGERRDA